MKNFFPFGEIGGDFPALGEDIARGVPVEAHGLSDVHKYLVCALTPGRALYVTADAITARRAAESIRALSEKRVALLCAKDEVLTYRKAGSKDALHARTLPDHNAPGRARRNRYELPEVADRGRRRTG